MAFLLAKSGPASGQRYDLPHTKSVLGRHPECDIVIEVGAVSRHHAQIVQDQEAFYLEDLESRNGTYLNNLPISQRQRLRNGDIVRVCDVSFTFHDQRALEGDPSSEGSALAAVFVDDDDSTRSSTIVSKMNIAVTQGGGIEMSASPEAKLAALLEITKNLGKALALDAVLSHILESLFKIFIQADRGLIVLKENGVLVPRWSKIRRDHGDDTIRISRTIINQVIDSKEAILSADAASDERFEMSQSIADFKIRSMMCAPLITSSGEAIGVLQIDAADSRSRYRNEDLALLVSIASQAGMAIDNARMYEQALLQRGLERDLELAHEVQNSFLPETAPLIPQYHFFNFYRPANQVGGDYYDYVHLPDGRMAIIVADVVGHGIAAALLMAKLSAETRFCLASETSPAIALTKLNDRMSHLQIDRFVTLVMAVLDPTNHVVTVVNAGHMAPILRKSSGEISEPGHDTSGLPIGITEGIQYEETTVALDAGDVVIMYTDGINERENVEGEPFGIDRIRQRVQEVEATPTTIGRQIIDDVAQFAGNQVQQDDMCLVCIGRGHADTDTSEQDV
jgi:serine phosphatase RsbU (regulator of sigma subunit)